MKLHEIKKTNNVLLINFNQINNRPETSSESNAFSITLNSKQEFAEYLIVKINYCFQSIATNFVTV